ncbi:MAG: choice-of-anchor Q domain-containing protein [Bacteroidota bacterium]
MKKLYLLAILLFVYAVSKAQLPMEPELPQKIELLRVPQPPGPPDACDMGGIYSIGPGGNFVTITEALDSLKERGVSANVILELNAAYTSTTEIFPIIFPKDTEIPCYGGLFSLILRPATGATNITIQGGSNSSIFVLDSCSYVTIDGRAGGVGDVSSLSIINDNASSAVDFYEANHNSIIYTSLSSAGTESGNVVFFHSFQGGGGCNFNSIKHCKISSPVVALAAKPVLLYSNNDFYSHNSADTIMDCEFYNFSQSAILIEANVAGGWVISGNSFYKNAAYAFGGVLRVINITSLNAEVPYTIENNFFGGTAAQCGGSVMDVGYQTNFTGIFIWGPANINSNKFARLYLHNVVISDHSELSMIHIESNRSSPPISINNNQFGGTAIADSIYVTNNNGAGWETQFPCIYAAGTNTTGYITGNYFSGIRCYGNSSYINLVPVYAHFGYAVVSQNQVGDPSVVNSLFNAAPGFTYCISIDASSATINGNTICNIKNITSPLRGINVNAGSIDSICNNTIFQLESTQGNITADQPFTGIYAAQQNSGGLHNLIEGNNIYSLYNHSPFEGSSPSGIVSLGNLNIRRNFIHNLYSSSNAYNTITGILVPDKESTLENNMISLGYDSSGNSITNGNLSVYGIVGGNVLRHNSVFIGGNNVADGQGIGGSACYVFIGSALNTEYHNNIFVNTRSSATTGFADRHQCINIDLSFSGNSNLFYHNGNGGILGTYQNTRYNTLAQWQAGSSKDAASLFSDPLFATPAGNASSADLHLQNGSPADGAGDANFTLATDFDGEQRNQLTPVDIGADAGIFNICPIANAGNDTSIFEGNDLQLGTGIAEPGIMYMWTGPDNFSSALANPIITPVNDGVYVLTMSTLDGCTSSDSIAVYVFPPAITGLCTNQSSTSFNASNLNASSYQWQANTGSGYSNISNNANYIGVTANTLQLVNIDGSFYGIKYRCIVDGVADVAHVLKFENQWTGTVNSDWNNTGNWSCNILPDSNTDVIINSGSVVVNTNGICRSLNVAPGVNFSVATGFTLTITH